MRCYLTKTGSEEVECSAQKYPAKLMQDYFKQLILKYETLWDYYKIYVRNNIGNDNGS